MKRSGRVRPRFAKVGVWKWEFDEEEYKAYLMHNEDASKKPG